MKAITFLGAQTAYETEYEMPDGKRHTAHYFGAALARVIPGLDMRVFVTRDARKMHWESFRKEAEDYAADVVAVDIEDGLIEAELWNTFAKVTDAVGEKEQVVFDITHGLRSLPFLSFLAAAYLRAVKNIDLCAVYYGNLELRNRDVNPNRAPVVDLTHFVSLLDWMVAADRFTRFGDAADLVAQLNRVKPDFRTATPAQKDAWQGGPAVAAMQNVSRALRMLRPSEAMDQSAKLVVALPNSVESLSDFAKPFAPLAQQVVNSFSPLAIAKDTQQSDPWLTLKVERDMVFWYLDHQQPLHAVATAREWLVTWAILHDASMAHKHLDSSLRKLYENGISARLPWHKETSQENEMNASINLDALPEIDVVSELYGQLGNVRNDLLHAGKRNKPMKSVDLDKAIREQCTILNTLPLPTRPVTP